MTHKGTLLLVEDNAELNANNARALKMRGYSVHTAATLAAARACLATAEPDVILLDVMLPDGDGIAFCAEICAATKAYILFLTAKSDHADVVRGLAAGGDDYIKKPFHPEELLARVGAAMRRRDKAAAPPQNIEKGGLLLDIVAGQATLYGENLLLRPREFALLLFLAQNEGKVFDAESLYKAAWGRPLIGDRNTLHATVSTVRRKLAHSGYCIAARRGDGYVFLKS